MKTGLILDGGAMRGMFTAGVLDVLMEQGITVDGMVGVSAGAVFGCNYKSHQIGRTIRYNTTYCNDKRYASFRNLLRTGNLYSEDFCYHEVPEKLDPFDDKAFRESPMDYFVVCTDVRTGDPIYYKCRTGDAEDVRWMEASASMPLAAKIVKIGHYGLLDGGVQVVARLGRGLRDGFRVRADAGEVLQRGLGIRSLLFQLRDFFCRFIHSIRNLFRLNCLSFRSICSFCRRQLYLQSFVFFHFFHGVPSFLSILMVPIG